MRHPFHLGRRPRPTERPTSEPAPSVAPKRIPTPMELKLSEELKNEGNELFRRGKYRAAADKYTEAITIRPKWAVLLVNRANCYKQIGQWSRVESDCLAALSIDNQSMKGHYFLGLALEERFDHTSALLHLDKSYELARDAGDRIMDEIWKTIARVSYTQWERAAKQREDEDARLLHRLKTLLSDAHRREKRSSNQDQQTEIAALEELFRRASAPDRPFEIPSCLTCPLTMEVFRDPMVTPSGFSYESANLNEHLDKVGRFDPITRRPIEKSQLVRNLNLRSVATLYLKEHPWAWKENM